MYRFWIFTLQLGLLASLSLPAFAQKPKTRKEYTPRYDRIATSILKRKRASIAAAQQSQPEKISDSADIPPAPTAIFSAPPREQVTGDTWREPVVEYPPDIADDGSLWASGGPDSSTSGGACQGCGSCQRYCWIDTISLFGGVGGSKGPFNRGQDGSFGFQEGFNWGSPWVFTPLGMNTQIGFRGTQVNFNGAEFTANHRAQFFVTAGFFRRAYWGWQGGLVFDYLHEDWYVGTDLAQLRGEISWAVPNGSSFGFWFNASVNDDRVTLPFGQNTIETWETHDVYAAFYRVKSNLCRQGQWRVFAGLTADSDGIIGSDFKIPMIGTWSLEPEFTYLIPDESTGTGGHLEESWNVAINLVWYPGRAVNGVNHHLLPMFDVASNGSMIARRK